VFLEEEKQCAVVMESFKKIIEIIKAVKKTFNKWKQKKIVWYAVNL
jgi:hypothetical protein